MFGGVSASGQGGLFGLQVSPSTTPNFKIKRVLVMFKCHFDAGFVNTQAAVVQTYFKDYFPRAIQIASTSREAGNQRYIWTTGSWLLYEYLEQADPAERRRMEQAIAIGDVAWHALPFNWQTELMDRSMVSGGLALSQALDRRFGVITTGAKMTDVPGHTRGLVGPLAEQGVTFLDIGVNGASRPAEVPPLFLWKDSRGATLAVMYHHGYGGIATVPESDLALATVVRSDNSGPHTTAEIQKIYLDLKTQFPNADVIPSNLDAMARAVEPYRNHLPVVTGEIGDTWIYGVASDPLKVARYREIARLRKNWIASGRLKSGDDHDLPLLRRLLLEPEHTWGTDTKKWLDFDHYLPDDLSKMLHTRNYEVVQFSWAEKRNDLFEGIATLPVALQDEALAGIRSLEVHEPEPLHGPPHPAGKELETEHFVLGLDPATGAITRLRNRRTGREWASLDHPLALLSYQTLSQKDYERFFANYIISQADWAKKDFGKPNMEHFGAESRSWVPSLEEVYVEENDHGHRLLARLSIHDPESERSGMAAFPRKMYMELVLPRAEAAIHLNVSWFQKPATRLPEAIWLTFNPVTDLQRGNWTLDKTGEEVSPFEVVPSGNRHMHAVSTGVKYRDPKQTFFVETLDAPLIAVGERSPLNFSNTQPDMSGGVHCNLFNNAWGTNYIMWFGEDMRFRFVLHA
jgi:hypothetical protein